METDDCFGLARLKSEGAPLHPDDVSRHEYPWGTSELRKQEIYNEWYIRQLQAYEEHYKK